MIRLLTRLLLVCIWSAGASAQLAQVRTLDASGVAGASDEVRKVLHDLRIRPVDQTAYPGLKEKLPRIRALFERLLIPEDGADPIQVVVNDNFQINAGFIRVPESKERIVMINAGMLDFLETDDELAAVLGHELEHGPSQLHKYVEQLSQRRDDKRIKLLFRTVENEVDAKSLYRRLLKKGFNPYAQRDVLVRLLKRYGNIPGTTHTTTGSRIDTLDGVYAVLQRKEGEKLQMASRSDVIDESLHAGFRSPEVKAAQLEKIQAVIRAEEPQFEKAFEMIRKGNGKGWTGVYLEEFARRLSRMEDLLGPAITAEEAADLRVQLHDELYRKLRAARIRVLGKKPKKLSTEAARHWMQTERIRDQVSAEALIELRHKILKAEAQVNAILTGSHPISDADQSMLVSLNRTQEERREQFRLLRRAFEDSPEVDEVIESEAQKLLRGGNDDKPYERYRWLRERTKLTGKSRADFDREAIAYLKAHVDQAAHEFIAGKGSTEFNIDFLDYDQRLPIEEKFGEAARAELLRRYAKGSPAERVALLQGFFGNLKYYPMRVNDDPGFYSKLQAAVADHATDIREIRAMMWKGMPYTPMMGPLASNQEFDAVARMYSPGDGERFIARRLELAHTLIADPVPYESLATVLAPIDEEIDGARSILLNQPSLKTTPEIRQAFDGLVGHVVEGLKKYSRGRIPTDVLEDLIRYRYRDLWANQLISSGPPKSDPVSFLQKLKELSGAGLETKLPGAVRLDSFLPYLKDPKWRGPLAKEIAGSLELFRTASAVSTPGADIEGVYRLYEGLLGELMEDAQAYRRMQGVIERKRIALSQNNQTEVYRNYKLINDAQDRYIKYHFGKMRGHYNRENLLRFYEAIDSIGEEVKSFFYSDLFKKMDLRMSDKLKFLQAFEAYIPTIKTRPMSNPDTVGYILERDWIGVSPEQLLEKPPSSADEFTEWTRLFLSDEVPASAGRDALVAESLRRIDKDPAKYAALRELLKKPQYARKMRYAAARRELAHWQLEQSFGISKMGAAARANPLAVDSVRKPVIGIRGYISDQFPEANFERNDFIDEVEKRILSTPAENARFAEARLNAENWVEMKKIHGVDLASTANSLIKTNHDRLEIIRYLLDPDMPDTELYRAIRAKPSAMEASRVRALKTHFYQANIHERTFLLLPLLDETKGILSEAPVKKLLQDLILGEKAEHQLFRAVFEAYLDSVHPSDAKVVLGHVLSSFVENKASLGRISLKSILESMGPMGVRAGQFAYSSGLITGGMADELKDLLDRALEPNRTQVIADIKKVFGANLKSIESLDDVIGAGSINYGFKARIRDPGTGTVHEAFVRVQRPNVVGLVDNENAIWKSAISRLENHPDPKIKRFGSLLEELRENAHSTLQQGGIELDHRIEISHHGDADRIYRRAGSQTSSGMEIAPTRPLDPILELVPPELRSQYSVYEYADTESWDKLLKEYPQQARTMARDAVSAELDAIFSGHFDADGHRGNWLPSRKKNTLWRADYAQLWKVGGEQVKGVKETLKLLAEPVLLKGDVSKLAFSMQTIFAVKNGPVEIPRSVVREVADHLLSSQGEPLDRLFAMRETLENLLDKKGYAKVSVRLNPDASKMVTALGKTRRFSDIIGIGEYNELLAGHLGITRQEKLWVGMHRVQEKLKGTPLNQLLNGCNPGRLLKSWFSGRK